jgi:hypothetical protein
VANRMKYKKQVPDWYLQGEGETLEEDQERLKQLVNIIDCLNAQRRFEEAVPYKWKRVQLSERVASQGGEVIHGKHSLDEPPEVIGELRLPEAMAQRRFA